MPANTGERWWKDTAKDLFKHLSHKEYLKIEFMLKKVELTARKEAYLKGFKDGFDHSGEGFNGECCSPKHGKDFLDIDAENAWDDLKLSE